MNKGKENEFQQKPKNSTTKIRLPWTEIWKTKESHEDDFVPMGRLQRNGLDAVQMMQRGRKICPSDKKFLLSGTLRSGSGRLKNRMNGSKFLQLIYNEKVRKLQKSNIRTLIHLPKANRHYVLSKDLTDNNYRVKWWYWYFRIYSAEYPCCSSFSKLCPVVVQPERSKPEVMLSFPLEPHGVVRFQDNGITFEGIFGI